MKNSNAYAIPVQTSVSPLPSLDNFSPASQKCQTALHLAQELSMSVLKLCAVVAASTLAGWCSASMVSVAFEAGYRLISQMYGQPDSSQGVIAAMLLWFAVLPFSAAFAFGYCKVKLRGSQFWDLIPAVGVSTIALIDFIAEGDTQALIELFPWVCVAIVLSYSAFFLAQFTASKLHNSMGKTTFAIALAAFVPAGVFIYTGASMDYRTELVAFSLTIAIACFLSVRSSRSQTASEALKLTAFIMSPVMLSLTANVIFAIATLYLNALGTGALLGWRAVASAAIILFDATAMVALGTTAGYFLLDKTTSTCGSWNAQVLKNHET